MAEEKIPISEAQPENKEYIEIKELKERIRALESQFERKELVPEEKEKMIKREIKEYIQEVQQAPSFSAPVAVRDEAKEISKFEPSQQVGTLVNLVFEKGLVQAISIARDLDNPAVLDELHDILVDRYYEMLIEKGVLKP